MANPYFSIANFSGGLNDFESPLALADDNCVQAENVEFFYSQLGERRFGCTAIGLPASITADANIEAVTWMGNFLTGGNFPAFDTGSSELWVLGQNLTTGVNVLTHRNQTVWATVTPNDAITATVPYGHRISTTSLHKKFFFAYKSAVDQLHVWDGTQLRKCGLAQPVAAPTGANTGGGAFAGTRYYRVRYVVVSGTTVKLRSEPSAVLTFVPSGAGTGVIVTKPAAISQGETHWELEASTDNANFYQIARTLVATTTYTDFVAFATGYTNGTLSEPLTSYSLIPSGRFLSADTDRLLIAGSWENSDYNSRLWWTPVFGATGVGNDERLDMTVNPYLDLDGFQGGEITGMSQPLLGVFYVFKWSHIYQINRQGQLTAAYSAIPVTKERGAIPGSVVTAVDRSGNPANYFLDPCVGPMRIGVNGLEWCGKDVRNFWTRVNVLATVPAHGVFYQKKNQVHFWVAVDGANYPNAKIIVQCNDVISSPDGARRGWVTVPVGDRIADAHCSVMYSDNVDSTNVRNPVYVPFIGKKQWVVSGATIKNLIQRCDTGTTDCFTTGDTDAYFYASVQSRPYALGSILTKFAVISSAIVTTAVAGASNQVYLQLLKNFSNDENNFVVRSIDVAPTTATESIIVNKIDDLAISDCQVVSVKMGDLDTNILPTANWTLHQFVMKISSGQSA